MRWLALAAALPAAAAIAAASQPPRSALDPDTPVAPMLYVSPFAGYMLFEDRAVGDWTRLNQAVAAAEAMDHAGHGTGGNGMNHAGHMMDGGSGAHAPAAGSPDVQHQHDAHHP
ncbi:hypothetical protein GCM10023144_42660 [Pigmentiphaga soli]|uniref:Uncharacterized protein n=2 Tax=Pigmentiphaga soli TaxID=1007095 RepID=A0ABP8HN81_9BURK